MEREVPLPENAADKVITVTDPEELKKLESLVKIHCCECGLLIEPNPSNTCVNCLKS